MYVATDKDLRALLRQIEICARFGLGWVVAHYEVHRHDVDCISHRLKNTREIARRKTFQRACKFSRPQEREDATIQRVVHAHAQFYDAH